MDFITRKEVEAYKGEVVATQAAIEADKYAFETKLLNGMGKEIIEHLKNPPKPNKWLAFKLKWARRKKERQEKREYEKVKRDIDRLNSGLY